MLLPYDLSRTILNTVTLLALVASLNLACATPEAGPETTEANAQDEAMAAEHQGDNPEPSAAATLEPRMAVVGEEIEYGNAATGYWAEPEEDQGGRPGLIVIHEWWGLNDNIRAMTRRLAGEGYVALAVDLYGGEVADDPEAAMALVRSVGENPQSAVLNLDAARQALQERGATSIGVIGWCFGGAWSLQTAIAQGDAIDAAVVYYGRLPTERAELEKITAPVLGLFGGADSSIPVDAVNAFEQTLDELGKEHSIHIYDGAGHAFANPSGTRYDAEAADDAWTRTVEFLDRHLRAGG